MEQNLNGLEKTFVTFIGMYCLSDVEDAWNGTLVEVELLLGLALARIVT